MYRSKIFNVIVVLCVFAMMCSVSIASARPFHVNEMEALLLTSGAKEYVNGNISGVVVEGGTGEPLIGANVVIKGTTKGTATDPDGRFIIRNIEAGPQTLVVSYLGFQSKEIAVDVADDETIEIEVELLWEGVEGDEVTITAQARGQVAAINQQLTSNTIANIVAKDRIQELPDVNAAESVGRLPGVSIQRSGGEANKVAIRGLSPKYNAVTINGVRLPSVDNDRSVDLSLISSNMLDGIEVRKANTADMDADALGGSIDLKLREAPDAPTFNASVQGGYNKIQDYYGNYKFSVGGSSRFFDDKFGIIANINGDEFDRSADKFSGGYQGSAYTNIDTGENIDYTYPTSVNLREESVIRRRYGGSAFLDYRIENGKITANGLYSQLQNEGIYRVNNMNAGLSRHYYQTDIVDNTNAILALGLGAEKDFGFIKVDATLSHTSSKVESPENLQWVFSTEQQPFILPNDITIPTVADTIGPSYVVDNAVNDSSRFLMSQFSIFETQREENTNTAQFNLEVPFTLGDKVDGFVKTGGKFKWLERFNDQEQSGRAGLEYGGTRSDLKCATDQMTTINLDSIFAANAATESLPISDVLNENYSRSNFLDGDYDIGFVARDDVLRELAAAAQECGYPTLRNYSLGSIGSDYEGEERYQAGYVMAEINLGNKITFLPGVRYEREYSKYTGYRYVSQTLNNQEGPPLSGTLDGPGPDTLTTERDFEFLLPMIHLQYEPFEWMKVRLAYTQTLTRPDFSQYAPNTRLFDQRRQYYAANTALKPAVSTNYDASVSFYGNKLGLFTIAAFYKSIDDLIYYRRFNIIEDFTAFGILPPQGANVPDQWYQFSPDGGTDWNSPFESVYSGIEVDWQTNFWYLPSFLKGIVLNVNLTLLNSETTYLDYLLVQSDSVKTARPLTYYRTVEDTTFTDRIQDQPGYIANITLGYDFKGFSARLSGIFQSDVITGVNPSYPLQSTFTADYYRLDFSARQKIYEGLEIFLNLNNLNARADRTRLTDPDNDERPTYTEYYGLTADLGIRYSF